MCLPLYATFVATVFITFCASTPIPQALAPYVCPEGNYMVNGVCTNSICPHTHYLLNGACHLRAVVGQSVIPQLRPAASVSYQTAVSQPPCPFQTIGSQPCPLVASAPVTAVSQPCPFQTAVSQPCPLASAPATAIALPIPQPCPAVIQPPCPTVVQPPCPTVVQPPCPAVVQPSNPTVVQPPCPTVVQPPCPAVVQPSNPTVVQPPCPTVVQPPCPAVVQPSNPTVVQRPCPTVVQLPCPNVVQPPWPPIIIQPPPPPPPPSQPPPPPPPPPPTPTPVIITVVTPPTTTERPRPEPIIRCPTGTILINRICHLIYCGTGIYRDGKCIQTICPEGTIWDGRRCKIEEVHNHTTVHISNAINTSVIQTDVNRGINYTNNVVIYITESPPPPAEICKTQPCPSTTTTTTTTTERTITTRPSPRPICCIIVLPNTCHWGQDQYKCGSRKVRRCGPICTQDYIHLTPPIFEPPPMPPPQPSCVENDCNYNPRPFYPDCSRCDNMIGDSCSSHCQRSVCESRHCESMELRSYCGIYPGSEGCRQRDGCSYDWCGQY